MTPSRWCWDENPLNDCRHCTMPEGHTGDHVQTATFDGRTVVVASWPGVNSKVQTSPTRTVQP